MPVGRERRSDEEWSGHACAVWAGDGCGWHGGGQEQEEPRGRLALHLQLLPSTFTSRRGHSCRCRLMGVGHQHWPTS